MDLAHLIMLRFRTPDYIAIYIVGLRTPDSGQYGNTYHRTPDSRLYGNTYHRTPDLVPISQLKLKRKSKYLYVCLPFQDFK